MTTHVVGVVREALGQQPAGGDVQRPAGPGQADLVPGGQGLDAADAGDDLDLEVDRAAAEHLVQHVQRAVVDAGSPQARNAPCSSAAQLVGDQPLVDVGPAAAPDVDCGR